MTLRLRTDEIRERAARKRLKTQTALAAEMGVSPSAISKQFAGIHAPSAEVIEGLFRVWPNARLRELFEVVDDADQAVEDQPAAA